MRQQIIVKAHQQARFVSPAYHGQFGRMRGVGMREHDAAIISHRIRPPTVGPTNRSATYIDGHHAMLPSHIGISYFGITLVVVHEVESVTIGSPGRGGHTAVQVQWNFLFVRAICTHHVHFAHLVSLHLVIKTRVENLLTIWGNGRAAVGAVAVGKVSHVATGNVNLVDFIIAEVIFPVLVQVS